MPAAPATSSADTAYPNPRYAWYVVSILTLAYLVSFLDRQILALLVEPIRRDLDISDTQVSLLGNLAFGIFYTVLGLPIGRAADRFSRRGIITAGITIWCLMTAACGLARNFLQLFLARVGVGVGEATLNPAALSMISDLLPARHPRPRADLLQHGRFAGRRRGADLRRPGHCLGRRRAAGSDPRHRRTARLADGLPAGGPAGPARCDAHADCPGTAAPRPAAGPAGRRPDHGRTDRSARP